MNWDYIYKKASVSTFCLGLAVVCLGMLLGLNATPAFGQSTSTGTVRGLVTDQQGAAVVGAEVKLIDPTINRPLSTTTNDTGRYVFVNVNPGTYDITVTKSGFSVAKVAAQKVTIGTTVTVDFTLQVGSASTTIVVEAKVGAELQMNNATLGASLSGLPLRLLPNLGRDVTSLLIAQPGVSPDGYSAGANFDQNLYQLDGGQNSNDMDGSMSIYTPSSGSTSPQFTGGPPSGVLPTPIESIEEFKVSTANQTADFNGAAGAQVQLATKRGTDSWHGAAYEYYLGSNFGANTWDNNFNGVPKVSTHQNRFGAAGGGPITPKFWGGKTYFFADYEGLRYPLGATFTRTVPSALFRQGIIQISNGTSVNMFNMTSSPITVGTTTLQPATCGAANNLPCDPRGLWFNPTIAGLWSKYMPLPNITNFGDKLNTQGFQGTILTPVKSEFGVVRIDHDFGSKWHFMSSYRVYDFLRVPTVQTDIGGFFPGDKLGVPASTASRPQKPWFLVAGMTTNISANLTNDFHFSYLRNYWSWVTKLAPPQVAGIPGAIEISPVSTGAESSNALIPFNVNTQSIRQRFWDGQDWYYRDDLSLIHGNHLFQFGGLYQHNWNFHTRDDNGSGTFNNPVFLVSDGDTGVNIGANFQPQPCTTSITTNCLPAASAAQWNSAYADLLGISAAQVAYTRSGPNLSLQSLGTDAFDKSTIDTYNIYFSDTWHMKPSFTLNYGLGYLVETPPHEQDGKQILLVDSSGNQIDLRNYMATRQRLALAGQIFNPPMGYELVGNVGKGLKYPYPLFWGGVSPRVSAAWNPKFGSGLMGKLFGSGKSVIRGGYSRIYGRQNGVDLVLIPLLGVGLLQAVKCPGATFDGNSPITGLPQRCGNSIDPSNAFRIGIDPNPGSLYTTGIAQTLPQPFFPGLNQQTLLPGAGAAARASDTLVLNDDFKPSHSDQFNITYQRDMGHNLLLEVGYIGRRLRDDFMNINIDQIPWMLTVGGQTFADAYAKIYQPLCGLGPVCANNAVTVPAQPWFETALGGPSSAYCTGFANCTAAVISKEGASGTKNIQNQNLYTMWNRIAGSSSFTVPGGPGTIGASQATSVQVSGPFGRGNYNALIVSLRQNNWHGVTLNTNFTWSRSLGTQFYAQANNGINPNNGYDQVNWGSYGPQTYDLKFVYNLQAVWQIPFHKNQSGFIGRLLGGWSVAPFFTAKSGYPILVYTNGSCSDQSFGQGNCTSGNLGTNALLTTAYTGGSTLHGGLTVATGATNPFNVGINGNANRGGAQLNLFNDPIAVYNQFRPYILGLDNNASGGGGGPLRGLSHWNLDLSVSKDFRISERFGLTFVSDFANIFNHVWQGDPYLDLKDPKDFGAIGAQINSPRQIEFGLRFRF